MRVFVVTPVICALFLTSLCTAKPKTQCIVQGYVRDEQGKPVKGAHIHLNEGSYVTIGRTDVLPIMAPHVFGEIIFSDSGEMPSHEVGPKSVRSDHKGHYQLKVRQNESYTIWVQNEKLQAHPTDKSGDVNGLLRTKLAITIKKKTETIPLDIVLHDSSYKNPCPIQLPADAGDGSNASGRRRSGLSQSAGLEFGSGAQYEHENNQTCAGYWYFAACRDGSRGACPKSPVR